MGEAQAPIPNIRTNGNAEPENGSVGRYDMIHTPTPLPPMIVEETVDQRLARAEKQIAIRKGFLKLIAANLEPGDITLYGEGDKETIHLTKAACKQILGWAGIMVQPDSNIQEKRYDGVEGPYIDFEVWATWMTPDGRYYRAMGNRSTYDDFFAKRTKWTCEDCGALVEWRDRKPFCTAEKKQTRGEKTTYYLPLSEVDIPAIKQAAITNLWNHIVEDAGLKPSKKELLAVGFKFDQVKDRVTFGDKKETAPAKQPAKQNPAPSTQDTQGAAANTPPVLPQSTAAPSPKRESGPPKAQIPPSDLPKRTQPARQDRDRPLSIGHGIISEVYLNKGKNGPYIKVVQNGNQLSCFANHTLQTMDGEQELFDVIKNAKGRFCEFAVETKGQYHNIIGARRIGSYEWDEQGEPVIQRGDAYTPTDEDVPF